MKREPIRVNDAFMSQGDESIWVVTECYGFGRGYWCMREDRRVQAGFKRQQLERMLRVESPFEVIDGGFLMRKSMKNGEVTA